MFNMFFLISYIETEYFQIIFTHDSFHDKDYIELILLLCYL